MSIVMDSTVEDIETALEFGLNDAGIDCTYNVRQMKEMIGNRYELKRNEKELLEIEKDLAEYLKVPFVKCSYDGINSHKYKDKHEVEHRKKEAKETGLWDIWKIMNQVKVVMMERYTSCFILKVMEDIL